MKGLFKIAVGYVSLRAVWDFAKEGLKLASDLNEVQNVVSTTFGESTTQINAWSKAALKAYGLGELQAKQYTGTMGAMLKSSGISNSKLVEMSTTIAGLTGDFASFYNLDHETAFEKLRSGISGETELLKQLGINMSVANLEAYALTKGITKAWKDMSQNEQVMLRYNYLLKVSKDAQGDFAKTYTSAANQQRLFQINMQQLSAKMMVKLLPTINKITIQLNKLFDGDLPNKLTDFMIKAANAAEWMAKNWKKLLPIIEALTVAYVANKTAAFAMTTAQTAGLIISKLSAAWNTASAALALLREGYSLAAVAQAVLSGTMWACPVTWIAAAIMGLVVAGYLLVKNWNKVKAFFVSLWNGPLNNRWIQYLIYCFAPFIGLPIIIVKHWSSIKWFFINLWNGIRGPLNKVVNFIAKILDNGLVKKCMFVLAPFIAAPLMIIKNWGKVRNALIGVWKAILPHARAVGKFFSDLYHAGDMNNKIRTPKGQTRLASNASLHYARGTNFHPGGWAITGENGPEMSFMPRGTKVINANRTEQLLNALAGGLCGLNVTYAPQYNISGDADRQMLEEVNRSSYNEFERNMSRFLGQKKRVAFA
jgi:hypothetical protein